MKCPKCGVEMRVKAAYRVRGGTQAPPRPPGLCWRRRFSAAAAHAKTLAARCVKKSTKCRWSLRPRRAAQAGAEPGRAP